MHKKTVWMVFALIAVSTAASVPAFAEDFAYDFTMEDSNVCKDSYVLLFKSNGKSYACVKESSADTLIDRGWGFVDFTLKYDEIQPGFESKTTIVSVEKIYNRLHLIITLPHPSDEYRVSTFTPFIVHFALLSFSILGVDYIDTSALSMPYISDDGTSVFWDEYACARLILLVDVSYFDRFFTYNEAQTLEESVAFARNEGSIAFFHSYEPNLEEFLYDKYCLHELSPGEDPSYIQKNMVNYVKSEDWVGKEYERSCAGTSICRLEIFTSKGYTPSSRYDDSFEPQVKVEGPAKVSDGGLRVYLDQKDCSSYFGHDDPITGSDRYHDYCVFDLPYGGNVGKTVNAMNTYVNKIKDGTWDPSHTISYSTPIFSDFYYKGYY